MKKINTRNIKNHKYKDEGKYLHMLTCYDYQSAQMLSLTELDMILVGDSLGNVILGFEHTIPVKLEHMITASTAVKRGAPNKFIVADLPFGSYSTLEKGLESAIKLFQESKADAVKLEGASSTFCELITRLTEVGIPVMGHIGLTPQSVNELGGYYMHGKTLKAQERLLQEAKKLEESGAFAIVLECVTEKLSKQITNELKIPTIGIGSGNFVDGKVLVLNDLLGLSPNPPPSFCKPIANLFEVKRNLVDQYLNENKNNYEIQ